jgi:hypothetical protein
MTSTGSRYCSTSRTVINKRRGIIIIIIIIIIITDIVTREGPVTLDEQANCEIEFPLLPSYRAVRKLFMLKIAFVQLITFYFPFWYIKRTN